MLRRTFATITILAFALAGLADAPKLGGAKTPEQERATFQLALGFRIELVASEPQVMDPVAMAFDQDGRLYVAEMRGYPNDGYGTGNITSGCIKLLEDKDGDGVYETATVFADGLRFPTSIQPWGKGILVTVAPDLIYLEDTKGTGKADVKRVLYTGFGVDNIQQLLNSVQWGMDNRVYACNGASGGTITSPEKPGMKPVSLGNRGIRFHPETPGSLEPMSGGGQFGLSPDAGQHWFTATNSQHLRQIILPDHYLRRNPGATVPATTLDIPEHGPACKVFRISPFEAWRVERTGRRAGAPDAARYPKTELVPGGFITSACSPVVYEAKRFPADYRNSVYICEPANNLVLRDKLEENGPIFKGKRVDMEKEFLASTDTWFRPVNLTLGPDGALYVVDFYREVIETPRSLPDDMKPKLVLQTQNRGRIWRVVPDDSHVRRIPRLSQSSSHDLVSLLADENLWWRLTAQRLLVERQDKTVVPALNEVNRRVKYAPGRAHALWTLHGLHSLDNERIVAALKDESALVREQALRLTEDRLDQSEAVRKAAAALADDPSPRVRFQAAFSLGETAAAEAGAALIRILLRDDGNPWTTTAVLSSSRRSALTMLEALVKIPPPTPLPGGYVPLAETARLQARGTELAAQIAAAGTDADLARTLDLIAAAKSLDWQVDLLDGVGRGLQNSRRPLTAMWKSPPESLKPALARLRLSFERSVRIADSGQRFDVQLPAINRLARGPYDLVGPVLIKLISPSQPDRVQFAATHALASHDEPGVAPALLAAWPAALPTLRREIQEAMFERPSRLPALLDAIEAKTVRPSLLDATRLAQLRKLPDAKLRERATKLLASAIDADRQKVVEAYKSALDLKADPEKGKAVFRKTCAACHQLEGFGKVVGPDLKTNLRDKTPEQLLISILDPSREVDRRYIGYVVETKSGRQISGLIETETGTSLTLRRAEQIDEVILRTQIETISDTGKSLMPDGLEKELDKQAVADVIAYLRGIK